MISKIKKLFSKESVLKHSSMIFLASLFGSLALFISSILLADFFGPEDFANFKIATNLFIFLPSLIELGLGVTLTKYIAEYSVSKKHRIPHLIIQFLKIRTISFAVLIAVLFLLREQIAVLFFHSPEFAPFVLAGLWISGFIFFEIFKDISLGFQKFKVYAVSDFLMLLLSGILSLTLGYFFGVFWAIIGWGTAYLIGNIPAVLLTTRKLESIDYREFNTKPILASYSLPMFSLIIPNLMGTALIPLLSIFFEKELVGLFAFGMVFFNGAILIPSAFCSVILPKAAEARGKGASGKKILAGFLKKYTIIVIPLALITLVIARPVIGLVAPNYLPGAIITEGLVIAGLLLGYLSIARHYYAGLQRVKLNWIIALVRNILLLGIAIALLFLFI